MSNESKENSNMHDHTNAAASHDRAYPPGQEDSHAVRYWLGQEVTVKGVVTRVDDDAGREAYVANIKDTP